MENRYMVDNLSFKALQINYLTIILFLDPEWALSQQPMTPKAEWAIDSEAMRARGKIVLVKSYQLVKNIETKLLKLVKARL